MIEFYAGFLTGVGAVLTAVFLLLALLSLSAWRSNRSRPAPRNATGAAPAPQKGPS